jgi:hypothetical protein
VPRGGQSGAGNARPGSGAKHIVIAGVVRTSLANPKIAFALTEEAMEKVIHAFPGTSLPRGGSGNHKADHRPDGNIAVVGDHRFIVDGRQRIVKVETAEGVKVRHLIKAKAADQPMDIARFQPRLKDALLLAALQNIFQNRQGGSIQRFQLT